MSPSKDVISEESFFYFSYSFKELLSVVSWIFVVFSEMQVVSVTGRTRHSRCLSSLLRINRID